MIYQTFNYFYYTWVIKLEALTCSTQFTCIHGYTNTCNFLTWTKHSKWWMISLVTTSIYYFMLQKPHAEWKYLFLIKNCRITSPNVRLTMYFRWLGTGQALAYYRNKWWSIARAYSNVPRGASIGLHKIIDNTARHGLSLCKLEWSLKLP